MDNYKYESFRICLHLSLDYDVRIFFRLLRKLIDGPLIELSRLCTLLFDSIFHIKHEDEMSLVWERDLGGKRREGRKGKSKGYLVL